LFPSLRNAQLGLVKTGFSFERPRKGYFSSEVLAKRNVVEALP
jgi:hypothetical protein